LVASALLTIIGGLIVSFSASWQITLTMVTFIPIGLVAVVLINYFLGENDCSEAGSSCAKVCRRLIFIH
jgi:membrane protein implicated in regulation of membrane protease activity